MEALIANLQNRQQFADDEQASIANDLAQELIVLQSIYGNENVELKSSASVHEPVTFQVQLMCADMKDNDIHIKLQVQLPEGYPICDEAPTMELVNRTVGIYQVDPSVRRDIAGMFGPTGATPWASGEPVLFQGIDTAYEKIRNWLEDKVRSAPPKSFQKLDTPSAVSAAPKPVQRQVNFDSLVHSDIITERKSEFLGHAARITHPDDVRFRSNSIPGSCFSRSHSRI